MLKAAAGGGGRGMRRVDDRRPADAMAAAAREAPAAFGDGTLYLERHDRPRPPRRGAAAGRPARQAGGAGGAGLQRPAPAPEAGRGDALAGGDAEVRAALAESARRVAGTVDFHNAATVEFLVDAEGGHYFLEMNTRLQVEHGVTELVTGLDLVAWQIRVAAGEPLDARSWSRSPATPSRRASTPRIPYDGFRAGGRHRHRLAAADGPGIRVDTRVAEGTPLTAEYDPLLAKLMVHAHDRPAAVARLRRALDETLVGGLQTDLGFHRWLVDQPEFVARRLPHRPDRRRWPDGAAPRRGRCPGRAAALEARSRAPPTDGRAAPARPRRPVGTAGPPPGPAGRAPMTDYRCSTGPRSSRRPAGLEWLDRAAGSRRLTNGHGSRPCWSRAPASGVVRDARRTPHPGRRSSPWRERMLAEARAARARRPDRHPRHAARPGGASNVAVGTRSRRATAAHHRGDEDAERGPRAARRDGGCVGVAAGQAVAAGVLLLRLE